MPIRTKKRRTGYIALSVEITVCFCPALNNVENAFMSSFVLGSPVRPLNFDLSMKDTQLELHHHA